LLINPSDPANETTERDVEAAAGARQILVPQATTGHEIDAAFARLARENADALFVAPGALFATRRVQLAILAAHHHVPAVYATLAQVEAGGLVGYGTDLPETYRQVGLSTARILKGVKPADLPVLQAHKIQLAISPNTARALVTSIPRSLCALSHQMSERDAARSPRAAAARWGRGPARGARSRIRAPEPRIQTST